jgi:diaminohydroxyphosphoribosylaminopyrimidine deaminase/5-amino-6-(5-phosphoribosylamino)uracil reductase
VQESIVTPSITASFLRRELPTVDVSARSTSGSNIADVDVTGLEKRTDSWRVVGAKSFVGFALAVGGGQDAYTASGTVAAQVNGVPSGTFAMRQEVTRTNLFTGLTFNIGPARLAGEIGRVSGGNVQTFNVFDGDAPSSPRFYGSLGLRLSFWMEDGTHSRFMRRALRLAERGLGWTSPNPLVGAVVVRDGVIVGEGWHRVYGTDHAEAIALRNAGERARGATLHVNLEPCNHTGRTPPCTEAILAAGIRNVVAATADPNPRAEGGAAMLRANGVDVTLGTEEDRARELNAPFFHRFGSGRPWVTLKLAMSLDGAIADAQRSAGWLTSPWARQMVQRMRAAADAIAVGRGTVIADDPRLTVRTRKGVRVHPARLVFTTGGGIPIGSRLVATARKTPTWLVSTGHGLTDSERMELGGHGIHFMHADTIGEALESLYREGIFSLLVEGGAALATALLNAGLVDRLVIFRAPILLGSGSLNAMSELRPALVTEARRLPVVQTRMLGDDSMTTYALTRSW